MPACGVINLCFVKFWLISQHLMSPDNDGRICNWNVYRLVTFGMNRHYSINTCNVWRERIENKAWLCLVKILKCTWATSWGWKVKKKYINNKKKGTARIVSCICEFKWDQTNLAERFDRITDNRNENKLEWREGAREQEGERKKERQKYRGREKK